MGAREPVRLTLELVPRAEPIRGAIVDAGGAEREFSGWMQLCAALAEASNGVAAENDKRSSEVAADVSRLSPMDEEHQAT